MSFYRAGVQPRAVLKTKGTVFSHRDRPSPVINIFIFSGHLFFKAGKEIGIKDIAYVASVCLKSTKKEHQRKCEHASATGFILTREHTDTQKEPANNMFFSCSKLVLQVITTGLFMQFCH